ncbi:hypothetical protein C8R45DRAFT_636816 [Mycena sanguinolenta]|nr:hypothetical protein C8R45DRAFT_636816 [Mycena sanguinolenta]
MSDARRDLNSTLDPVARLPVEISSDIFARCIPDSCRPQFRKAPMIFLHICRIWRDIATSTPSLWTSISCESIDAMKLDTWLQRARGLPLYISLCGDLHPEAAVMVKRRAQHIRVLTLETLHLKEMVSPFLSLAKLAVINTTIQPPTHRWCMDILRNAPALVEGVFSSMDWLLPLEAECSSAHPIYPSILTKFTTAVESAVQQCRAAYAEIPHATCLCPRCEHRHTCFLLDAVFAPATVIAHRRTLGR